MASERSARIDAEIEALAKEKERYVADAAAMAKERQRKSAAAHRDRRELPLGYWLGWGIAESTRGSARLDLVRPRFPAVEPGNLFRRINPVLAQGAASLGFGRTQRPAGYQQNNQRQQQNGFLGFGQGARIKVMRHIDFGVPDRLKRWRGSARGESGLAKPGLAGKGYTDNGREEATFGSAVGSIQDALKQNFKPPDKPWFDLGAGVNLEFDEGQLHPTVRLKVKDFFSIKLFPEPMFKIQKRLRLGPSTMGLRINYELPLVNAENLWAPPARLMIRVDNHMGGLRLGPGGADFDESIVQLGDSASVRAALSVDFPKSLPLEEGEKLFGWRARRLGIKTRW